MTVSPQQTPSGETSSRRLIVGLGNAGRQYAGTRHNAGFMVVHQLAQRHGVRIARRYIRGLRVVGRYGDWMCKGEIVRLMLPQLFMNRAGEALRAASAWEVAGEALLVVCDDVSLPVGMLRMKPSGSAGGHKGLASCLGSLGTDRLARLRVGIGAEPLPRDLTDYVLSPFGAGEHAQIQQAIGRAVEACELWTQQGIQVTMNRINPAPSLPHEDDETR